ncbi:MAG: UTP--glucose-1-phosphate uridylyltransferase, partial [Planctomycetota bacterium]
MIRKAVIPAACFGTRFLPATKSQPKEMLPIVDTPVIQYVVEEAVAAGISDILMVIGKGKRSIEEHFDRSFQLEAQLLEKGKTAELEALRRISELADIHFVWQKEMKGLGDAVYCARHHVGEEPFAVLLGD